VEIVPVAKSQRGEMHKVLVIDNDLSSSTKIASALTKSGFGLGLLYAFADKLRGISGGGKSLTMALWKSRKTDTQLAGRAS